MEKLNNNGEASVRPHDCFSWQTEVWGNNKEYNLIECGVCGRITHFAFKSIWLKIRFLFWRRIKGFRNRNQENKSN